MNELVKLINLIDHWHLSDIAKRDSPYAYETALRIIDTGRDLQFDGEEFESDTLNTIDMLSNPKNWGIPDPEWKLMCESWQSLRHMVAKAL